VPRLHVSTKAENIAQSAAMDGIFPLTTNTKEKPIDVFKIYNYQPRIEKRHALLKSTLEVAPIWLKKNTRIEALMFLEFIAQIVAALIERELRLKMTEKRIDLLCSLPEGRGSKTPTIDQVLRLLESQNKHALYDGDRLIKQFCRSSNASSIANTSIALNTNRHLRSRQVTHRRRDPKWCAMTVRNVGSHAWLSKKVVLSCS
jgi:hypothetical protein